MNITYDEVLLHVSQIFYLTCLSVCLSVRHAFRLSGGKGLFRNIGFHLFFTARDLSRGCIRNSVSVCLSFCLSVCLSVRHAFVFPEEKAYFGTLDFIHFLYEHHL